MASKVTTIGEVYWTSGPVVAGPEEKRLRWKRQNGLPEDLRKKVGKVKGVQVIDLGGEPFLAVGVHNVLGWRADDRVLVAPMVFAYQQELDAAFGVDLASVKGWKEIGRFAVGRKATSWFDTRANGKGKAPDACSHGLATKLAPGEYVVETARHEIPSALTPRKKQIPMGLVRLRKSGEEISYGAPPKKAPLPALREVTKETSAESKKLRFVGGEGGPLVLMSRAAAKKWMGADGKHYDLACKTAFVAITKFEGGQVLVLGEPTATAFYPTKDGGLLLRWIAADSAAGLLAVAKTVPEKDWKKVKGTLAVDGELVLFDSVNAGTERGGLPVQLPKGKYGIEAVADLQTEVKNGKQLEGVMLQVFRLRIRRGT